MIGFGPNLKFRTALPKIADDLRPIKLTADPPIRTTRSRTASDRARRLDRGRRPLRACLLSADRRRGKSGRGRIRSERRCPWQARISIDLVLGDCDRLAGDRLNAQGVGPGVLPGRIDVAKALPACELAVEDHPSSGRFNYQLARIYSAAGRNKEAISAYRKAADLGYTRAVWALDTAPFTSLRPIQPQGSIFSSGLPLSEMCMRSTALGRDACYEGRGVPRIWRRRESSSRLRRGWATHSR